MSVIIDGIIVQIQIILIYEFYTDYHQFYQNFW